MKRLTGIVLGLAVLGAVLVCGGYGGWAFRGDDVRVEIVRSTPEAGGRDERCYQLAVEAARSLTSEGAAIVAGEMRRLGCR